MSLSLEDGLKDVGKIGALVGMKEEARLLRRFFPSMPIALSNAQEEKAEEGVMRLKKLGVEKLLSFGCAGGLDPALSAGDILLAQEVFVKEGKEFLRFKTDSALNSFFSSQKGAEKELLKGAIYHSASLIETAQEKKEIFEETGCLAVDMESGVVAGSGLDFAVLRVVCDKAQEDLPDAARVALKDGGIDIKGLIFSLLSRPTQLPSLISLGRNAVTSRASLQNYLEILAQDGSAQ